MVLVKKALRYFVKFVIFSLCFIIIFSFFQLIVVPKYIGDSTTIIDNFYSLEKNSVDVLFLGSSQTFCSIDDRLLQEQYGINAYAFASSQQRLPITEYFLKEAVKYQHPKIIMVEVSQVFTELDPEEESMFSYSYAPTKPSVEKFLSLYDITNGDLKKSISYTLPLFQYHTRWNQVDIDDVGYCISRTLNRYDYQSFGFQKRDGVKKQKIDFLNKSKGQAKRIPVSNIATLDCIYKICNNNSINVIFFKTPVTNWTRSDSSVIKSFMKNRNYRFVDFNDKLSEIGIDSNNDFFDKSHLNYNGAQKTTVAIAQYLKKNYDF